MTRRRRSSGGVPRARLQALLWAVALLLSPPPAVATWADVALRPPGEAELFPGPDAYSPVVWTAEQVESMRRRALLQLLAAGSSSEGSSSEGSSVGASSGGGNLDQLPLCELNLGYRVVDLGPSNFSAVVTLTNNRELDLLHWQVVWRFQEFQRTLLARADGAIALSLGSTNGAPVRLVDTFTSDGVPGGGGTFSFFAQAAFVGGTPPSAGQSLGIGDLNINGIQCSVSGGGSLAYGECLEPPILPLFGSEAGSGSGIDAGATSQACWAHFCCGVVLWDPSMPPPPPPGPPPAPPAVLPPLQPPEQPPQAPQVPSAPVPDVGTTGGSSGSIKPDSGSGSDASKSRSVLVPAAAGGGGAAAGLLLAGALLLLHRRRRRRRRTQQQQQQQQQELADRAAACKASELLAAEASLAGSPGSASSSPGSGSINTLQGCPTLGSILGPAAFGGDAAAGGSYAAWGQARCQVTIAPSIPSAAGKTGSGRGSLSDASPSSAGGGSGGKSGGNGEEDLLREVVLLDQLGSGAFGTVYRGEWQGRPVAVKLLQTTCGSRSRELESFRQEVRVLAGLRHPHIACLLAACTVPPNICIIEELAQGGSLHTRLHGVAGERRRRRPLPYGELLRVAADVADAMCYLHPRIVHRDLKAQNVLLDLEGRALVCDFGIAKFKDRTFVSTAHGQAGTPAYMAPEMFDNRPITEKVDVFSFSVLCWEMLTGEVPWRQLEGPMQVIYQVGVMRQRLPLPDGCPPFLSELMQECWGEEPTGRPGFPAILRRLRAELARVDADVAQQAQRVECRSTVSETDASSAAAGGSLGGSSGASISDRGTGSRSGWPSGGNAEGAEKLATPAQPVAEPLCSPFSAHAAPFGSSSSEGSGSNSSASSSAGASLVQHSRGSEAAKAP